MIDRDFKKWCLDVGGYMRASGILGIHFQTARNYAQGRQPIPRYIDYAVFGFRMRTVTRLFTDAQKSLLPELPPDIEPKSIEVSEQSELEDAT